MEPKQSPDNRIALLIDADNVSSRYVKPILDELSNYGDVTIKRIYGDWTLNLHAKWKQVLLENSITPIQQFGYTQGKNSTDSAMIIDAMDILYGDSVDGFCIVSSDSDFTRLASRLRESGRLVIGMGEKKTPVPFRRACDVFTALELLASNGRQAHGDGRHGGEGTGSTMSKREVEKAVVNIITDNQNRGKSTGLGEIGSRLLKRYPDFDVRNYGTSLLSRLLEEFESVRIIKDRSSVTVELTDATDAPEPEAAPEGAEEAREESSSGSSRRGRRGGRRRRGGQASSQANEAAAAEEASSQTDEAAAAEAEEEAPAPGADAEEAASEPEAPEEAPAEQAAPRSKRGRRSSRQPKEGTPQDYIRQLVRDSGAEGISLSHISDAVRAAFKDFKVRDLGFPQMRQYVASIDDFAIEKVGRDSIVKLAE